MSCWVHNNLTHMTCPSGVSQTLLSASTPRQCVTCRCSALPQTNLTWLDLSFNRIAVLEGVEKLTKLQDLSLFNNQISSLQGLDTLQGLHVLSIGKQHITLPNFPGGTKHSLQANVVAIQVLLPPFCARNLPSCQHLPVQLHLRNSTALLY